MTPPTPAPSSSVGRYVRAIVGVLSILGGIAVAVLLALTATTITWTGVALAAVLLVMGFLLTDPSALLELPALIRAWRGGASR